MEEEIEFECESKTEEGETEFKDEIKFKIEYDDEGLKIKVKYESETETEEMETETETEYEILFDRIVEYKPSSDGDGAFDWDEDTVVSEFLLTDFSQFSQVGGGEEVGSSFQFYIKTVPEMATFFFTISQGGEGEAVTANKMKIDFELKNYGWVESDTYVALIATVTSEQEVEIEYEDDREDVSEDVVIDFGTAVDSTGVRALGEFTWAKDAFIMDMGELGMNETMANETAIMSQEEDVGPRIDVIAKSPNDGTDRIAFSFVGEAAMGAADIYWDPEAGVSYSASGVAGVILSSAAVLSALTLAFLW